MPGTTVSVAFRRLDNPKGAVKVLGERGTLRRTGRKFRCRLTLQKRLGVVEVLLVKPKTQTHSSGQPFSQNGLIGITSKPQEGGNTGRQYY